MKNAVTTHLPDEHYVVRFNGQVKSHHRRFMDALGESLQLRGQFPQRVVEVELCKRAVKKEPLCTEIS